MHQHHNASRAAAWKKEKAPELPGGLKQSHPERTLSNLWSTGCAPYSRFPSFCELLPMPGWALVTQLSLSYFCSFK